VQERCACALTTAKSGGEGAGKDPAPQRAQQGWLPGVYVYVVHSLVSSRLPVGICALLSACLPRFAAGWGQQETGKGRDGEHQSR
jgi:hypothetical protein